MEKSMFIEDVKQPNGNLNHSYSSSSSQRHVTYSCGSCGYELNLSSSSRNTATIGSKYGKSIKRGIISFFSIDESRFTQVDEFRWSPYFSKHSWGLFRRRTKLLCRKCGNHIGNSYDDRTSDHPLVLDGPDSSSGNGGSSRRKYEVRIRSLQPSFAENLVSRIEFRQTTKWRGTLQLESRILLAQLLTWSETSSDSAASSAAPGSGIFAANGDNEETQPGNANPASNNKTGIRMYEEENVSPKKPTTLPEVAKQRELSGTLESEDSKLKNQLSDAKCKELNGDDIFALPPEILPRPANHTCLGIEGQFRHERTTY